jgi:hypothetical protein
MGFLMLLQLEKRRGQTVSAFFELRQKQISKQGTLVLGFGVFVTGCCNERNNKE